MIQVWKKSRYTHPIIWVFGIVIFFTGCKKENEPPAVVADKFLVSNTLIGQYDKASLISRLSSFPAAAALAQFDIKVYKITYKTTGTKGEAVTASGALLVPVTNKALPILSYQHGTIPKSEESRAPSYYNSGSEIWSAVSLLASTGYVVSAPDYIGYGASKDLPHPYEHAATLASTSLDLMRAVKEFCKRENISLNSKNFLLGYSEGGYATLALHKLMEEKYASEFTVTACAPGAGAYDKTAFAKYILNSDQEVNFISTYVWVLDTYNKIYNINRPYSYYFNEPWATTIQTNLTSEVDKHPKLLFTPTFRSAILDGMDTQMLAAFKDNDIYDWKPIAPLTLFHGTTDDFVPFFNSQHAYDAMQAHGALQVKLKPLNGDHYTSIVDYTLQAYSFILSYY
ncbi:MAG: alpha/beta fold hydrolase [Bacteroidota bacterium]